MPSSLKDAFRFARAMARVGVGYAPNPALPGIPALFGRLKEVFDLVVAACSALAEFPKTIIGSQVYLPLSSPRPPYLQEGTPFPHPRVEKNSKMYFILKTCDVFEDPQWCFKTSKTYCDVN
jgi:hypothetical protein